MIAKVRFNWVKVKLACQHVHEAHPAYYAGDNIAKREQWLCFTDDLSRAGLISQDNRDNWSCPW